MERSLHRVPKQCPSVRLFLRQLLRFYLTLIIWYLVIK
jgi:hypothetical protein